LSTINKPSFSSLVSCHQNLPRQTIPNNAYTQVRLDHKEIDLLNEFNIATSTFTPVREGYYLVTGYIAWFQGVINTARQLFISVGGITIYQDNNYSSAVNPNSNQTTGLLHLTPNNNVRLYCMHQNGVALDLWNLLGTRIDTHLEIVKVG